MSKFIPLLVLIFILDYASFLMGIYEGARHAVYNLKVVYNLKQGDILEPRGLNMVYDFSKGLAVVHDPRYVYHSADDVGPFQLLYGVKGMCGMISPDGKSAKEIKN